MNSNGIQRRLARLKRECDVSTDPAILLGVACTVFVLMLALGALAE